MSKIIKESGYKPKITPERKYETESRKIENLYSNQFIDKTIRVETCEIVKSELRQQIIQNAECNRWGEWKLKTECEICGKSSYTEERKCYNYDYSVELPNELCEQGASERIQNCLEQPKCPEHSSSWTCDSCPDACWGHNQPDQFYSCRKEIIWHGLNYNQYPMDTITKVEKCGKTRGTPNRHQIGRCKQKWSCE